MSSAARSSTVRAVRNLVFDLDGTLIDSGPGIASGLSTAFRSVGWPLDPHGLEARVRNVIGPPIGVIARRLEPDLTDAEVAAIERVFRQTYDSIAWRETYAFAGVSETLLQLKAAGHPLYILTNKPLIPALAILELLGLKDRFAAVLTRDTPRPHYSSKAAMLADLLQREHLDRQTTLLIGDTLEDAEAAESNGVAFVHAAYGYGRLPEAAQAIPSFPHLLELLEEVPKV